MRPPAIRFDVPPDRSLRAAWFTAFVLVGAATTWLVAEGLRAMPVDAPMQLSLAAIATRPLSTLLQADTPPAIAADPAASQASAPEAAASKAGVPGAAVSEAAGSEPAASGVTPRAAALAEPGRSMPLAAASHPGSAEIETCGGGWARLDADGEIEDLARRLDNLKRGARKRTLAALVAAPDELARATVLFLDAPASRGNDLARLARSSRDPRVYALAVRACGETSAGACKLLSATQWARLDPDNAMPWLYVAQAALAERDLAATGEAMYRLSLAQRSDVADLPTARALEQAPSDDATLPGTAAFLADVRAAQLALVTPASAALDYCSMLALHDANRWQVCAGIAEVLATRSSRIAERRVGTSIGEVLGWSNERLTELRAEQQAALDAARNALQPGADPLGCESARRQLAYLRVAAREGEVAAARQR